MVIVAGCHRKFPLKTSDTCLISDAMLHISDNSDDAAQIRKTFFAEEGNWKMGRFTFIICIKIVTG